MKTKNHIHLLRRLKICVVLSLCLGLKISVAVAYPVPEELFNLIDEVLANNRELLSLKDKAQALRVEAPFSGSLQNPAVSIAIANLPIDSFDFAQEPMTQKQISISQKVPWFGTLALAEKGAELKAVEQEFIVATKELAITRQVKEAWYDLCFLEQSLEVNAKLSSIITQVLRVAETRYATGKGSQQDILLAQVQLSELIDEAVLLKSSRRLIQDKIGSLLNSENLYFGTASALDFPEDIFFDGDRLTASSLHFNPTVMAAQTAVLKARVDVELAEKDYMPDMDFRLSYGQRDDDPVSGSDRADFLSAGITFTVPLWQSSRQDSAFGASEKRLSAAQKYLEGQRKTLPHRIDALLSEIGAYQENYRLVTGAISVQAEQLADSALAAYSVGNAAFAPMLSARIRQLQIGLKAEKYKYQFYKKLAELEETVGQPLTEQKENE